MTWAAAPGSGSGVLRLGRQVHPLVREAALPALRSLAEDIGATAHLTLVDGTEALAVAVVEPTWTDYHVAYRAGFRHPLDRGAAGRAILAARQQAGLDEPGYTLTHGELEAGASGAAAPLIGVTGVEGSVGVVMLADAVPERVGRGWWTRRGRSRTRCADGAWEVTEALTQAARLRAVY